MNKILLFLLGAALGAFGAQERIYASFDVAAEKSAQLSLKAAGIVKKINAQVGSVVKEGEILLELDNDSEKLAVKLAQNDIENATAAKDHAKSVLEKFKLVQSVSSKQAFEDAQFEFRRAQIAQKKAQIALESTQKRLEDTYLRAPFDGTISAKNIEVGEGVGGVAQKLMAMFSYPSVKLKLSFDEKFKDCVKIGSEFVYKLDGRSEEMRGKISLIYPTIDTKNGKIYAEVRARDLTPGLFGEGYILFDADDSEKTAPASKKSDENLTGADKMSRDGRKFKGEFGGDGFYEGKFGAATYAADEAKFNSEIYAEKSLNSSLNRKFNGEDVVGGKAVNLASREVKPWASDKNAAALTRFATSALNLVLKSADAGLNLIYEPNLTQRQGKFGSLNFAFEQDNGASLNGSPNLPLSSNLAFKSYLPNVNQSGENLTASQALRVALNLNSVQNRALFDEIGGWVNLTPSSSNFALNLNPQAAANLSNGKRAAILNAPLNSSRWRAKFDGLNLAYELDSDVSESEILEQSLNLPRKPRDDTGLSGLQNLANEYKNLAHSLNLSREKYVKARTSGLLNLARERGGAGLNATSNLPQNASFWASFAGINSAAEKNSQIALNLAAEKDSQRNSASKNQPRKANFTAKRNVASKPNLEPVVSQAGLNSAVNLNLSAARDLVLNLRANLPDLEPANRAKFTRQARFSEGAKCIS